MESLAPMDPNVESPLKRAKVEEAPAAANAVTVATTWSAPKECPCTAREAMSAAVVGPVIYLFGGLTQESTGFEVVNDIYRYDPGAVHPAG